MLLGEITTPSFIHVTVAAGEPDDVQFRVNAVLESEMMSSERMDNGAVRDSIKIITAGSSYGYILLNPF